MDDLNAQLQLQLQSELEVQIAASLSTQRPILTHLNADTTWLLSIPLPGHSAPARHPAQTDKLTPLSPLSSEAGDASHNESENIEDGIEKSASFSVANATETNKNFYHVLIDPWLKGSQSDVTRFLSQQWHAQTSCVQDIEEVLTVIGGIERLASEGKHRLHGEGIGNRKRKREGSNNRRKRTNIDTGSVIYESRDGKEFIDGVLLEQGEEDKEQQGIKTQSPVKGSLDLVVVSHEFTDHLHRATLLEVDPTVPVIATSIAAGRCRSWGHFHSVVTMPVFKGEGRDWRDDKMGGKPEVEWEFPSWLSVRRLEATTGDPLNYHTAVMIVFDSVSMTGTEAEAIIYTPHGISPENLLPLSSASPSIQTLALLHGMHDIRMGPQLNLGAHNGLRAQRMIGAKYWVGTHDEVKVGGGLVSFFLKRKVLSLEDALRDEICKEESGEDRKSMKAALTGVLFKEVANGESLVLE